ncbi:MAG: FAD-dependent oxidoreductase [Desulfatibacillaceae bacterium]|nr:FAD-dependent oxidoreductase [Desulfatibacillaceae bacterium]
MANKNVGAVMVVGGGIAGIGAALDLADSGYFVYLVEKSPGIGGTMAQLDKTFPTNDCAMCILSPKLVECGRHLNIELLTLSEVTSVTGSAGDFTVEVLKRARYIDPDKCIACGSCTEKCPRKADSEFDAGMGKRKAAYIKYAQTVPLKYVIDGSQCIYIQKGRCKACEKFCPTGAINFEDKDETLTFHVGSVILAPGFSTFDPKPFDFFGYGRIPDLVTSLEYERLLSANGPCMGHLVRPSDHREPKKIAWIQCVGSRSTNRCNNTYCSSVCCMYALKQALVTSEHLTGGNAELSIFYMDMRSHGKEFERVYETAKQKGVRFVRARPHTILPGRSDLGLSMVYATEQGEQINESFDMAILSVGLEAPPDAQNICKMLGIEQNKFRFVKTSCLDPVKTSREGIYATGVITGPKDIPQAVVESSAAAAQSARSLADVRGTLAKKKQYPPELDVLGQDPRIGVFVCSCGINIAGTVDVKAVTEYAKTLPGVVFAENNLFTCSTDTQKLISQIIRENNLNRVVIAACTPRTHEPMFQDTLKESGLNGYLVEMANIRNQNSWVHQSEPQKATAKAKKQVAMAVAQVAGSRPLANITVEVVPRALVVGGGLAGLVTSLTLADQGFETVLVEKEQKLGGNALHINTTWQGEPVGGFLADLIKKVENHPKISVSKQTSILSATGSVGHFSTSISVNGQSSSVDHGIAVFATGGQESRPEEYLYGQDSRVHTHLEFDALLAGGDAVDKAQSFAFIQCVGSREPQRPYCSRVCCTHTVKGAIAVRKKNPDSSVFVFYRDIRTYGEREDLYTEARNLGVIFVRYSLDSKPQVFVEDGALYIKAMDHVLQMPIQLEVDHLVLAAAIVPRQENQGLVDLYKCGLNADGFLNEAHPKLRPVDMSVEGLFIAGLCHYPKPVEESIAQAQAAASRAAVVLSKKTLMLSGKISKHNRDICMSCLACFRACPYGSPFIDKDGRVSHNEVKCTGCGICAGVCPAKAFQVENYRDDQILAMVDSYTKDLWENAPAR